ncbi:MAG: Ig-like domain-containing protein [Eubacterium sp.]|nr:Ig-like domain-containing protein [Eubacterium sp.]
MVKKKGLFKFICVLAAFLIIFMPINSYAESENPFNKWDNQEVPYDGSKWVQPKNWSGTIDPDDYTGNARITVSQIVLSPDMAGTTQQIDFNVSDAAATVGTLGFHIYHDTRLTPEKVNYSYINRGDSLKKFSTSETMLQNGIFVFNAFASSDSLADGTMFSIKFNVPADAAPGDVYPVGLMYTYDNNTNDLFINQAQDDVGKLQMAYIFSKGITNGYIKIADYPTTGTTGDCTWTVDKEKETLTISGKGAMQDSYFPWYRFNKIIKNVIIEEGVTHIGDGSFKAFDYDTIRIPDSVTSIGGLSIGYHQDTYSCLPIEGFVITSSCKENPAITEYIKDKEFIYTPDEHTFDEGKVTKEPSVDEEGEMTFTCTKCGTTKIEKINKLEPVPVPEPTPTPEPAKDEDKMGEDGTPVGKGASKKTAEAAITSTVSENDIPGACFNILQPKAAKTTKNSIKLKWKKTAGAVKYSVYGSICGKYKYVNVADSKATSVNIKNIDGKKLKKGTYYKFLVVAYDSNDDVVSTSTVIHAATAGGKVGNAKNVTTKAKKNKVSIKAKKTFKLKGKQVKSGKKIKVHTGKGGMRYESDNTAVATVDKTGKIKGVGKGKCTVYAYAQNGVFKKIKVTIK